MLGNMLQSLQSHMTSLSLPELTQAMRACFKVLSKIQMPVAYMDMEAESQTQDAEQTQVWWVSFTFTANQKFGVDKFAHPHQGCSLIVKTVILWNNIAI